MLLVHPPPETLRGNVIGLHGRAGEEWLSRLPALVGECAARWSLRVGRPFERAGYNYVAPASRACGGDVVLKLGVPGRSFAAEAEALRLFGGRGAVRLLEADAEVGAMLLERVEPGTTLLELFEAGRDEEATRAAAAVMLELRRPAPAAPRPFPSAADWFEGFDRMRSRFGGGSGPLPTRLAAEAETLSRELLDTPGPAVLLHADLHHENVLAAGGGSWLAVDPQGLIGEAEYETGALLRNPLPGLLEKPRPRETLDRRVALLCEALGFDRARVRGWAVAQAVLSVWWSVEDNEAWPEEGVACAELLASLRE
jgi:streptomycin 6-kinase